MRKLPSHLLHKMVLSIVGLLLLILFTACSGVGSNGNTTVNSLTGTITSVNASAHSVTISVNGQSYTINGLTDQEVQELQNQVGKMYTIHVTQNSDGSYTITTGTQPTPGNEQTPEASETPNAEGTPSPNATGESISFTGPIQSVSNNTSLTVKLPDGSTLTAVINSQTDQSDLNGAQLSVGQTVKVEANATSTGFVAIKIKTSDNSNDANTVDYVGKTTQTVGSDNLLRFTVGNLNLSFATNANTQVKDFANLQAIQSGTLVKVEVQFNGTTGTVTKVSNGNS